MDYRDIAVVGNINAMLQPTVQQETIASDITET